MLEQACKMGLEGGELGTFDDVELKLLCGQVRSRRPGRGHENDARQACGRPCAAAPARFASILNVVCKWRSALGHLQA
jgi:hypothetical protein